MQSIKILIYIQQDATLHSLFHLEKALHVSGGTINPSSGAQTTVSTASGICYIVSATCRYPWKSRNWFECAIAHSKQFQLFHDSGR